METLRDPVITQLDDHDYDAILKMFTSGDNTKPELNEPFIWKGYTGATNGHILILFPGEDLKYKRLTLDINRAEIKNITTRCTSTLQKLTENISKIPLIEEKIKEKWECAQCEGSGETECNECGNIIECKECDGTGSVEKLTKKTGNLIINPKAILKIENQYFSVNLILDFIKACEMLGVNDFELVVDDQEYGLAEFRVWMNININYFPAFPIRIIVAPIRLDKNQLCYPCNL